MTKITVEVSDEQIEDLLCSAFEGGSGYWARCKEGKEPTEKCDYLFQWPLHGGSFLVVDTEEMLEDEDEDDAEIGDPYVHEVTRESLTRGLEAMASLKKGEGGHHFRNMLQNDTDSETGDVFLQCCIFGKVIYG
jgi:hypothetical protein